MNRPPRIALWLPAALLLVCSCTHNPRMISGAESDYLLKLRAEYLASNPEGQYNEFIQRGEVVKGMDILEVLAAWGHPKLREKRTPTSEDWLYRTVDEDSGDWYEYIFRFQNNVLSEWELTRNFAAGGSIPVPSIGNASTLSKGAYAATQQSETPKK